jgi:hypothetical protein
LAALLFAGLVPLGACGGDSTSSAPVAPSADSTPTPDPTTTASEPPAQPTGATIEEVSEVIGVPPGEFEELNEQTRSAITRACDEGFVNTSYEVVDGGTWIVGGDFNEDAAEWVGELEEAGIAAEVARYCDLGS